MGRYVQVVNGAQNVELPNGRSYTGPATVLLTDEQFAQLTSTALDGNPLVDLGPDVEGREVISLPVSLADLVNGDVLSNWDLDFAGRVVAVAFVVTDPVTTAGRGATLNLEVNTTNLTGGVVTLTSANCATLGAVVAGTAITANNQFEADDTLSVEASSVTAFAEGAGVLLVTLASR